MSFEIAQMLKTSIHENTYTKDTVLLWKWKSLKFWTKNVLPSGYFIKVTPDGYEIVYTVVLLLVHAGNPMDSAHYWSYLL